MITSTTRNFTQQEKQRLIQKLPSLYKRIESFILKLMAAIVVLLIPLLIYDHFSPVVSGVQAIYCIVIIVLAVAITVGITKKQEGGFTNAKQINQIETGQVEVVKVQTTRAIKRKDFEDFGIAYYLSVTDNGQQKTLYLWGYSNAIENHLFTLFISIVQYSGFLNKSLH